MEYKETLILIEIDDTINLYDESLGCVESDFQSPEDAIQYCKDNNYKLKF